MTPFETWLRGVIAGVGEPLEQVSSDTHHAWSCAETLPYDLMRWNNPQNSTEKWYDANGNRVSWDSGAQPGPHDVQIYPSVEVGIAATVWNLINEPYYPAIVANLRAGLPRQQWGLFSTAATELHAWGTGSAWLLIDYGPAPTIGGDMTPEQEAKLDELLAGVRALNTWLGVFGGKTYAQVLQQALPASGGGTEPPEPAEPKTVTLHIPAQDIKGDLA
jgi:hypothetical protein